MPADVRDGAGSVNTDGWGTPFAFFPSTASCNLPSYFGPHRIVINLTLCTFFSIDLCAVVLT